MIDSAHLMRTILHSLILLLATAAIASAQAVSTAQINGTVKDSGGLALPGVTVTVTQTGSGLSVSFHLLDPGRGLSGPWVRLYHVPR